MTAEVAPAEGYKLGTPVCIKGWILTAYRLPYYEQTLEFIQVDHPDGTSSYFRSDGQGGIEAGPFGGGMSWTVPKYVVKTTARLFNETFPQPTEEGEAHAD